ncbi:FxsA family protein [Saccharopolyspora sp. HNM0983]|uniref:FxsA family protein n=1 Tax=Saccharopolyspora montiporae TaxID=2781240 RepID=A0A929BEA9_9PSEU|nr:FxsA family protein [Saccharopolyspora sp. HNM0983]MBE9376453.1 FxsA family protein [Saccharopolyspora sp. HNM0983]
MPLLPLLLVAAVVEIGVLVLVGQLIGVLPTLLLVLGTALLGSWLLRREGRRTLEEFRTAAMQRTPPERELSDGVLVAGAALLIIVPGFVTDLAGLVLLLPPVRAAARKRMARAAERRSQRLQEQMRRHAEQMQAHPGMAGMWGAQGPGAQGSGGRRPGGATGSGRGRAPGSSGGSDDVIDGEVVSVTEDDETADPGQQSIRPGRSEQADGRDDQQRG